MVGYLKPQFRGYMTENCEWCGKPVANGRFSVVTGYAESGFLVGDCCGVRGTGLIKREFAGPLLTQKDHSQCCGRKVDTPYAI